MKNTPAFESQPCSRCGGCGNYSYCSMYGTTCFKCGGRGWTLTKRGTAASVYYNGLCSKRADEVKVGDLVYYNHAPIGGRGFSRATFVGIKEGAYITVDGVKQPLFYVETEKSANGGRPEDMIRMGQTLEEKREKMKLALEYQASLTLAGTPRKNSAMATA